MNDRIEELGLLAAQDEIAAADPNINPLLRQALRDRAERYREDQYRAMTPPPEPFGFITLLDATPDRTLEIVSFCLLIASVLILAALILW